MGFYLPGLVGIFTLFPATGMGLILLGTLLILRIFFLSRAKPSKKKLLSNKIRNKYANIYSKAGMVPPPVLTRDFGEMGGFSYIFDFLLFASFIGLLLGIFFDFSHL